MNFSFKRAIDLKYLQIYDNSDVQYMVNGFEDDEDFINFDLALDETLSETISPVIGGFQLLDLIITELKSHMPC